MNLKTEKVLFSKRKNEIKRIYFSAFEKKERMPFTLMMSMSILWNTEFLAFYDNEILCGFIYLATIGRQSFVMFFAVDESLRGKGYGSEILDIVSKRHKNNKIILSIEPLDTNAKDYEMRVRRKGFYLRAGFVDSNYYMKLNGVTQEVLVKNGQFNKNAFIAFFMLYSNLTVIPKVWKKVH